MKNVKKKGSFMKGAAIGAVIGAVLGVLFAPAPGKETRRKIKSTADGALNKGKAALVVE